MLCLAIVLLSIWRLHRCACSNYRAAAIRMFPPNSRVRSATVLSVWRGLILLYPSMTTAMMHGFDDSERGVLSYPNLLNYCFMHTCR